MAKQIELYRARIRVWVTTQHPNIFLILKNIILTCRVDFQWEVCVAGETGLVSWEDSGFLSDWLIGYTNEHVHDRSAGFIFIHITTSCLLIAYFQSHDFCKLMIKVMIKPNKMINARCCQSLDVSVWNYPRLQTRIYVTKRRKTQKILEV